MSVKELEMSLAAGLNSFDAKIPLNNDIASHLWTQRPNQKTNVMDFDDNDDLRLRL
jgi:hypothetical protein